MSKHYIRLREDGAIIKGFSTAFFKSKQGDVCINSKGETLFRLFPELEADPELSDEYGIPLFEYVGGEIRPRAEEAIAEERAPILAAEAAQERIEELKAQLAATDYIAAKIAEGSATREEYADMIAQRQAWRAEINELGG